MRERVRVSLRSFPPPGRWCNEAAGARESVLSRLCYERVRESSGTRVLPRCRRWHRGNHHNNTAKQNQKRTDREIFGHGDNKPPGSGLYESNHYTRIPFYFSCPPPRVRGRRCVLPRGRRWYRQHDTKPQQQKARVQQQVPRILRVSVRSVCCCWQPTIGSIAVLCFLPRIGVPGTVRRVGIFFCSGSFFGGRVPVVGVRAIV